MDPDWEELWRLAAEGFILGPHSLHGPDHWQRVERNGLEIAPHSGADEMLVRLFAVLHDSQRQNEITDPEHGQRAADWAKTLRGQYFDMADDRFAILTEALIWHDKGKVSSDPTIGTCWDADRLDLPRVGITPDPRLMSTNHGKALTYNR